MKKILLAIVFSFFLVPSISKAQYFDASYQSLQQDAQNLESLVDEKIAEAQDTAINSTLSKAVKIGATLLDLKNMSTGATANAEFLLKERVKTTFTDAQGNKWDVIINTNSKDIKIRNGAMKGCKPLAMRLSEFSGCIMCPMFKTIFDTANTLITNAFNAQATLLKQIMSIVFALIIAIKVLMQVSSITAINATSFIEDIAKQTFKFMIAFAFLTFYKEIFYWIFNPLLQAGIEMGAGFLTDGSNLNDIKPTLITTGDFFSTEVHSLINRFAQAVQQHLAFMQAVGSSLICISFNDAVIWKVIPDGSLLVSGGTMYLLAIIISVAFGFYLIDAILQLCIVGVLTPFSIAAYPFNFSQKWMSTTWKIFLDTFFKFVFMGLIISLITTIMAFAVTGGLGGNEVILEALNQNNSKVIANFFDITSIAFISFIIATIFANKLTKQAAELASSMSGGSVTNIGTTIGTMAVSAITNAAKRSAMPAGQNIKKAAQRKAKDIGNKIKDKAGGGS